MNQLLQNRYNELGREEIQGLKFRMKDSPKILRLLDLLDSKREKKLNTVDIVNFIYEGEAERFEVLRNRFFKLRKQLLSSLDQGKTEAGIHAVELLPLEEKLYQCRRLIYENHFQLARKELRLLLDECRKLNIFELIPEIISQLIYANLAINKTNEIESLTDELTDASAVLHDFRTMQALSRKLYVVSLARQSSGINSRLSQMRRLAIRRSAWPRFKLCYHFCVFTYAASSNGKSIKSSMRQLDSLRKMISKYPLIPVNHYEANASTIMEYYILSGEGALHFIRGDMQACYLKLKESWDIQERIPNLRMRKSESYYSNRVTIEIATGRFREALKTADELIEFQKEQRNDESRLRAYAEVAMIYSYAYPQIVCPNPDFLIGQLKAYIAVLRKNKSGEIIKGLTTIAILYFLSGDFKAANRIMKDESLHRFFRANEVDVYNKLLVLNPASPAAKISQLDIELDKLILKNQSSEQLFSFKRAKNMLGFLVKSIKKN